MSTPLILRPIGGLADVEYNLGLIAQALANIDGAQIVPGTLSSSAINGDFMPRAGGAFTGAVEAPAISIAGTPVALAGVSYSIAQVDALLAAKAGTATGTTTTAGLMRQANAVTTIGFTPSGAYSQSEAQTMATTLNSIINALKNAGLMA